MFLIFFKTNPELFLLHSNLFEVVIQRFPVEWLLRWEIPSWCIRIFHHRCFYRNFPEFQKQLFLWAFLDLIFLSTLSVSPRMFPSQNYENRIHVLVSPNALVDFYRHCVKSVQIRSIYAVNLCIQSESEKMRTRKNSVFGHFLRSERQVKLTRKTVEKRGWNFNCQSSSCLPLWLVKTVGVFLH